MTTLIRPLGVFLIVSILLAGCTSNTEPPVERDPDPMDVAPAPTTGMCAVGQVLTCSCSTGGAGTLRCLDTGVFGECTCRASEQPQKQADCQPGSLVVCDCPGGGKGNHRCLADSTFEPCGMCIGGAPVVDADAG